MTFVCLTAFGAQALDLPGLEDTPSLLTPRPIRHSNPLDVPSRAYTGVPVAGWMVYPSLLAGVVFDDNVYQSAKNRTSASGVRVKPGVVAVFSNGIHKTTVYGEADARFYPSRDDGNVVEGRLGGVHTYEMRRDLVFRVQGEASRRTDVFNEARGAGLTGAAPQRYNQYLGALSAQKSFGRFFTALGGTLVRKSYNDSDVYGTLPDQTTTTLSGRVGYWATPIFYGFIEPSMNWRRFDEAALDSNGYRIVGGVGTDRISLFRGEVFAGYQEQRYQLAQFGNVGGGVFGGRLFWYPTRALTFGLQVDQTIGDSTQPTLANPFGSATRATAAHLRADYKVARSWGANARVGFEDVDFVASTRRDKRWLAGATLNYDVFRNVGVALDYQFVRVDSNFDFASYDKNVVTLGATYKY